MVLINNRDSFLAGPYSYAPGAKPKLYILRSNTDITGFNMMVILYIIAACRGVDVRTTKATISLSLKKPATPSSSGTFNHMCPTLFHLCVYFRFLQL